MAVILKPKPNMADCMPEIVELVEQLRPTGTGFSKLERLSELGCETKTLEAFLERAAKEMPVLTMEKIKGLWGAKKPEPSKSKR
jgi:hypothetical protein